MDIVQKQPTKYKLQQRRQNPPLGNLNITWSPGVAQILISFSKKTPHQI